MKHELETSYSAVLSYIRSVANTADGAYNAGYLATRIEAEVRRQKNAAPMSLGLPVTFTGQLEATGE